MLLRFLTIALLTVTLAACSSTEDEAATDPSLMGSNTMSSGPLEGTEVYDGNQMGGVAGQGLPGSQEDLATNVGDRVFFGYDRYDLAPEAQTTLDGQAAWLAKYPSVNVTIEGHSDERGTREYNLALAEDRAKAVRRFMRAEGAAEAQLGQLSFGEEKPTQPGQGETVWALNRRVELVY